MRQHGDQRKRLWSGSRTTGDLALIVASVWFLGSRANAFTGDPKGYDSTGHLSKAQFMVSNWPHVSWNYEWYSGQPTFAGSYPPGYHALLAALSWSLHISLGTAMKAVAFAAVVLVVGGLYGTVRAATSNRLAALLAAGLLVVTPTLWAQNVVLGLYPRFTALAFLTPAVALAIVHARRGGRLSALGTCLLLLATLSMHPIVGAMGLFLVGAVHVLGPRRTIQVRAATAAAVVAGSLITASYFYLPLLTGDRSQSAFTDHETPLPWRSLVLPGDSYLDGLSTVLLPLALVMVVVAILLSRRPQLSFADLRRLGTDVVLLVDPSGGTRAPESAGPGVAAYFRWHRRRDAFGFPLRVALLFAALSGVFLVYGFIGYLIPHFPLYVNGLQPADLLVYPAFLLAGVIGLVAGGLAAPAKRRVAHHTTSWRIVRRVPLGLVAGCLAVLVVAVPGSSLVGWLDRGDWGHDDLAQASRVSVLPSAAAGQRQYRVTGMADSTTRWINAVSDTPQTRGYNDHGALQLDWQVWLERSLGQAADNPQQAAFLLDWYGIKWVDTDSGSDDASQFDDPARYERLATRTSYATFDSFEYRDATPILSASNATSVLVVGDEQHYDLLLRALAYAGVDSRSLILVRGPAAVDDLTAGELKAFDGLVLYGASVRSPSDSATVLRDYVKRGGGLMVDAADDGGGLERLAEEPNSPLPVAFSRSKVIRGPGWSWADHGGSLTSGTALDSFAPASFADSNRWQVAAAIELRPWAHAVLDSHGATVLASGKLGKGTVVWSGIGLPFHANAFTSQGEAAFLGKLIVSTTRARPHPDATYHASFLSSEHRRIRVEGGAGGVLLKEQLAAGWHAEVDGRELPIHLAGPGMMWVPLAAGQRGPVVVDLVYRLSALERLAYVISALALLFMLTLMGSPRLWELLGRRAMQLFLPESTVPPINPARPV
jgi:uncharacterized protein DUF6541